MPAPSRALVTGARGFLGRRVIAEIRRRFSDTEIVAVSWRTPAAGDYPGPSLAARPTRGASFADASTGCCILRRRSHRPTPSALYLVTVLPSLHLLDACRGGSRPGYVSSISVIRMSAAPVLHEGLVPIPIPVTERPSSPVNIWFAFASSSGTGGRVVAPVIALRTRTGGRHGVAAVHRQRGQWQAAQSGGRGSCERRIFFTSTMPRAASSVLRHPRRPAPTT